MTPASETVGLTQCIAYAEHLATEAELHSPTGNQGYLARLAAARVTGPGLSTGRDIQDAFAAAAAAATRHAAELTTQIIVQEQYDVTPSAGDKTFLTDDTTTDRAAPEPAATPAPAPEPEQVSERERLARGLYIGAWPAMWHRDRAREWDAGRVDADEKAETYARADEILAERARIAAGPGADRLDMMRTSGVTRCPSWCPQPDDEDQYEEHVGPGQKFTTEGLDEVLVVPRASWWADGESTVDLVVVPRDEGGPGTLTLNGADLLRLQQLTTEVLYEAERQQRAPAEEGKPAYPGAYYDAVDAVHEALDPAVAGAALDAAARTGTFSLSDAEGAPGMDWSDCDEAGVRRLEASDGEQTAQIELAPDELAELRDELGRLVGLIDDGQPAAEAWGPADESDGAYIDWSVTTDDGGRQVEIGDGEQAAQFELTPDQLRDWFERLDLQVHLDANDGLDLRARQTHAGGTR